MSKKDEETAAQPPSSQGSDASSALDYVSLIEDPYGFKHLEIAEAQNEDRDDETDEKPGDGEDGTDDNEEGFDDVTEEELETAEKEDFGGRVEPPFELQEDCGELDALAKALEEQRKIAEIAAEALAEWTPDSAVSQAERLASQIAEDQELTEQLALAAGTEGGGEDDEQGDAIDPELQAALPRISSETGSLDVTEVQSCLEALLFMSDKPLSLDRLQEMIGPSFPPSVFQEAITSLTDRYRSSQHGIEVAQIGGGFQFRTKPGRAALAKKLAKTQTQRLSSGAMETLAIVAYRQPVMKEDIDKIRGVDSSYFVRHLLDKKLIQISGRSELPGRPMLYGTTDGFLSLFSLKDLSALPSLREIEQMVPASQGGSPEDEDPRVKEMRRLVGQMKTDTSSSLVYDPREDEKILKDIKERINRIPTSTPSLDEQRAAEKALIEAAKNGITTPDDAEIPASAPTPELPLER